MTVKYLSDRGVNIINNVDIITNLEDSNDLFIDSDNFTKSTRVKTNKLLCIINKN